MLVVYGEGSVRTLVEGVLALRRLLGGSGMIETNTTSGQVRGEVD
jgi:hypothetical protein